MSKVNKAGEIAKLLMQGRSVKTIKKLAKASESYIYLIKKQLEGAAAATAEEAAPKEVEAAATTIRPSYDPEAGEYVVVEGAKSIQEIDAILNERGSRYGNFLDHATITYQLKEVARDFAARRGKNFAYDQCEALDMIFHKLGRILNGDPNYADSWIDIAGYAQLVADRLQGKVR